MQCHLIRVGPRRDSAPAQGAPAGAGAHAADPTPFVRRVAAHALPLDPSTVATDTWSNADGSVRVWTWTNEEAGPLVRRVGRGCVVGSGYAHRPLLDVARDAAGAADAGDAVLDAAGGIWSLAQLDDDGAQALTSHAGIEAWFHAEGADGSHWLCTRPLPAHLAARGTTRPELDPLGLAGIVNTGHCLGSRTPYAGTRHLGRGARWSARPGPRVGDPVVVREGARPLPPRGSEDRVGAALARALVAAAAELPETEQIRSGLTGGRDSRIVVAALVAGGHDVLASTRGWEGHHDVVVARRVAEVLGIPHVRTDPASASKADPAEVTVDPALLLWRSAVLCDGMIGAFDATGGAGLRHRADRYGLSGSGGEIHRGGHASLVLDADGRREPGGPERAERWLRRQHLLPMRRLLRPDVREAHDEQAESYVRDLHERHEDTMADYFLEHRVAQWYAGARLGTSLAVTARTPFLDDAAILATSSAGTAELHSERPLRDALAEIDPRLLEVPFVGARLAGEGPEPVAKTRSGAASFSWKTDYGEELARVLRRRIDACPVLVDGAAERHLPPGGDWTKAQARRAWHAASAGTLALEATTSPAWRAQPAHGPVVISRARPDEEVAPEAVESGGGRRQRAVALVDRAGLGRPARALARALRRLPRRR